MKQCIHCGAILPDPAQNCRNCGAVQPVPYPAPPFAGQTGVNPPQAGTVCPQQAPGGPAVPPVQAAPQPLQVPAPQWRSVPQPRRSFSWADVCTVMGFTSSVIGFFWASLVLLPLGLVTSLIGFKGDKTRALAVAGIVVSVVGLLIKVMMILNDANWLPYWITNGIW